ncbi:MAG: acetylglutamate kinase [Firmicutes bacterium]|nr:acetylglutamate kinase [Bacillota bacterium]
MIGKAEVLVEALPYIQRFAGKTVVIKVGGSTLGYDLNGIVRDIVLLKAIGLKIVVVHGGGKEIDQLLERLGLTSRFVDGLRYTDPPVMEAVEMVLIGRLNPQLVGLLQQNGDSAIGLSGVDGGLLRVAAARGGALGLVGTVIGVNSEPLHVALAGGFTPVVATVGLGPDVQHFNVNADEAAGALAAALHAEKLILLTDVPGLMDASGQVLSAVGRHQVADMIASGDISGGMLPKVAACLHAVEGGARRAHMIDGRIPHALLLEIFTTRGIGTMMADEAEITPEEWAETMV